MCIRDSGKYLGGQVAVGHRRVLAVEVHRAPAPPPAPTPGGRRRRGAVDLYGEHPAVADSDLAAEVLTEVRLLTAVRAELVGHAEARADAYRWTDPARPAASLPGLAEVGAPTVTAIVGRAARFRTGKAFRSFTGLAPRASETGETDRKG